MLQIAIGNEYASRLPIEHLRTNILSLNIGYEYVFLTTGGIFYPLLCAG